VSYLTARRFSAQDRVKAIRAKRLKADANERETGPAAAEIALMWLRVLGNPGAWTVTNITADHSGGNRFATRLAVAVAERLSLGQLQLWRDRTIRGVSHPKEFPRLPPLDILAGPIGVTFVIDEVATVRAMPIAGTPSERSAVQGLFSRRTAARRLRRDRIGEDGRETRTG
jgi:hypothetical protein